MRVQFRRKALAALRLLSLAGALLPTVAGAQKGTGSLTGRLTDLHSVPLANVSITLRNDTTGVEVTATSSRGGRYSFKDLAAGEYTLNARAPRGTGEVGGITVSPGHELRVQTAIDIAGTDTPGRTSRAVIFVPDSTANPGSDAQALNLIGRAARAPETHAALADAAVGAEQLAALPLAGSQTRPVMPSTKVAMSAVPITIFAAPQLQMAELVKLDTSLLIRGSSPAQAQIAAGRIVEIEHSLETLSSAQLESLPVTGRDWGSFLTNTESASIDLSEGIARSERTLPRYSIDGHQMNSAFGHGSGARVRSPAESAIGEVKSVRAEHSDVAQVGQRAINIETQHGTDHLHGQMFLFNRQHLLNAQNPFTTWMRETAPRSGSTVPSFTAEPYSPSDLELRWGVGAGGLFRPRHVFWFAALDGVERNYPAVSAVRHPDRFFAQPENDQMQLLSAQLGLSSVDPVAEGVRAYSKLLESLAELLGPAARSSQQLSAFERLDWRAGDRHRFMLEGTENLLNAPGGGSTRAWQTYGTHSFGSLNAKNVWLLGRWQAFVTPNLLAIAQGSIGREIQRTEPQRPSPFEQSLNINSWGQLPQIVVDSQDGFTIGNPARFAKGKYPDESIYSARQQLNWVYGNLLWSSGLELSHERDATSKLRNQTGTYYYSTIGDFASDALAFFAFGLNGQLNPMDQHNCDQRGRPWRDSTGVLHGLGYLPCYSQTIGPSGWWLATNDWAGHSTLQWQAGKQTVFTIASRWELEQLPRPIWNLDNPDLPLTQHLPALGSQWGPRAGFAWGSGETHWPVLRIGYGMYFGRTPNAMIQTALTQTGSPNGDVNLFMRPTDNLNGGGAPPFPYVLAGKPGTTVSPGAVEFAPSFRNSQVHQAEVSLEETLPGRIHLEAAGTASLGRRLPITTDANIDPAMNPKTITYAVIDGTGSGPIKAQQITVPFFASWPSAIPPTASSGRMNPNYQQVSEISSRANSTYEALLVRLSRSARGLTFRGRYIFAHAADWNPDEGVQIDGPSVLDPNDFRQEYGTGSLDIRHSATAAVILQPKWRIMHFAGYAVNGWMLSGVGRFHSGLPYSMRTAGSLAKEFDVNGRAIVALSTGMNGYGGDNRVYGVGRNTFRYPATWKADLRLSKRFNLGQMRQLELMAESFNLFNHQNVTQVETVGYSIEQGTMNGAMPRLNYLTGLKSGQTEFGKPLDINASDLYRERQVQFGARMRF